MPEKYVDLHLHTTASDSTSSPAEVLEYALKVGLSAIAITDHDTLDGFLAIQKLNSNPELEIIPAVELSCNYKGEDVHIIGYLMDQQDDQLLAKLQEFKLAREKRGEKMVQKLNQMGLGLTMDKVKEVAKDSVIGRPHLADALLQEKYINSYDEAFIKYLGYEGPAYVAKKYLSPQEALNLIHQSQGVAVLAHPGILKRDDMIVNLIEMGLDGIEAYHSQHDYRLTNHYINLARKLGVIYCGGSDCHGKRKGRVLIGTAKVPYHCLTMLKTAQHARIG